MRAAFILILIALLGTATLYISALRANNHQAGVIIFHADPAFKAAGYPFSQSVEVDGLVILSGVLGTLPGTTTLAKGGIEGEATQVMNNIKATLQKLGLGMDRVVKCTVMIEDMADWPTFNTVYKTYFPSGNFPARSAFGADGLALGAKVEVECWAHR